MKIAVLTKDNSYVGSEYISRMVNANLEFEILVIGKSAVINPIEEYRCGGLWRPSPKSELFNKRKTYRFDNLQDKRLLNLLEKNRFEIGIQGGVGILKENIISKFELGIMNFHPGDLPYYRGCSAPEWQIKEGKEIICTCHKIAHGIDTGEIFKKKKLNLNMNSYFTMRASVYPEISKFVVEVLNELIAKSGFGIPLKKQDESKARYREYIGDDEIRLMITDWIKYLKR